MSIPLSPKEALAPQVPGGELQLTEEELASMGARWAPGTWAAELRARPPTSAPAAPAAPAPPVDAAPPPTSVTPVDTAPPATVLPPGDAAPPAAPSSFAPLPPPRVRPTPLTPWSRLVTEPSGAEAPPRPAAAATGRERVVPRLAPEPPPSLDEGGAETQGLLRMPEGPPPPPPPLPRENGLPWEPGGVPAWERLARQVLQQREAHEPLVILDPLLVAEARPSEVPDPALPESGAEAPLEALGSLLPDRSDPTAPASPRAPEAPRTEGVPAPPPPWFERFFDADYCAFEPQPSERLTEREADFMVASFGLAQGARILDLACGTGRHACELARRGFQVVGLDLSKHLLERAAAASRARKLSVDFVHGDMRSLAFRRLFDGVLLWGTSFGYFRDAENALVLRKIAQALRPGGRLLLELCNRDFVLRDLPRTCWRQEAGGLVFDEQDFEWRTSRFRLRRSTLRPDGTERVDALELRGYSLAELLGLLAAEGFVPLEISGRITTRGAFFGAESPSILLLAELR